MVIQRECEENDNGDSKQCMDSKAQWENEYFVQYAI
jgi:hypothetical protein